MGQTSFWPKETNFTSFMHKAMPLRKKTGNGRMSKAKTFATKSPANAGLFNFR
jgi:hypothetical protein